jgi:hypothetical protein
MILATVGVVGSVAVAHAQTDPGPGPGGPAPAPPAPAPAPAPAPNDPSAPAITITPVGTPSPDAVKKEDKKSATGGGAAQLGLGSPNPFRTSWFNWQTSASSKILAVGEDYIGTEDEVVSMDFSVTPRYSYINTRTDWGWIGLNIPWSVELTNSDSTTKQNQVMFGDLGIQTAYNRTLARSDKGLVVLAGPRASVLLPTSLASQFNGTKATTSFGLGGSSNIPLRSGDILSSVFVAGGLSWQHLFSDSTGPFAEDEIRPRQGSGAPRGAQLIEQNYMPSGQLFNSDTLGANFSYWLTLVGDLSFGNSWGLQAPFRYAPTSNGCEVYVANKGCVSAPVNQQVSNVPITVFDVSLSYTVASLVWVAVGYNNTARQLGDDGRRQSIFYSNEGSTFYASASVFLDAIYSRVKTAVTEENEKKKNAASSPVSSAFGF